MQVDIVTPEKVLFSEKDISMVTIPGIEGQMGILDDHLPVVTFLKPGVINVEKSENKYFFTTYHTVLCCERIPKYNSKGILTNQLIKIFCSITVTVRYRTVPVLPHFILRYDVRTYVRRYHIYDRLVTFQ